MSAMMRSRLALFHAETRDGETGQKRCEKTVLEADAYRVRDCTAT